MCGIVGYIGKRSAQQILVSGLKRLEYRGYDSAGIATLSDSGKTSLLRAVGKVEELAKLVGSRPCEDKIGIGHTRWATHGEPAVKNAHPHQVGKIALVHNGIIENYQELKSILEKQKYKFKSETDSEVLAALIDSFYTNDLIEATSRALKLVVGTYGLAIFSSTNPDEIIVARNGSPLILGIGDGEIFVASDATALLGYTRKVIYLNDGEVGSLTREGLKLQDLSATKIDPKIEQLESDIESIQKKGFKHFLNKEIHEQPTTLRSTLAGRLDEKNLTVKLGGPGLSQQELKNIEHILIVGCGTAYHAGLLASYYLEQFVPGLTTEVEIASELRYKTFNLPRNTAALIVSQSGETADTLACLTELQRRGIMCLGIVNAVGSTIARTCGRGIYVHVGAEISVASTKAFTSQVSAMLMFGLTIAEAKGSSKGNITTYVDELAKLPGELEKLINSTEPQIKKIATKYKDFEHSLYLGRDTFYPIALEGALKLKEISYIHAEGYAAGELKHGPIALVDDRFFEVIMLPENPLIGKSLSGLAEVNSRHGHTIVITNSLKKIEAESIIKVKTNLSILAPLVFNVVNQLLAYYMALARKTDVDKPRNLAKSVTVE